MHGDEKNTQAPRTIGCHLKLPNCARIPNHLKNILGCPLSKMFCPPTTPHALKLAKIQHKKECFTVKSDSKSGHLLSDVVGQISSISDCFFFSQNVLGWYILILEFSPKFLGMETHVPQKAFLRKPISGDACLLPI